MQAALRQALDTAQNELADAELQLLEARGRAEQARVTASRLAAAVAALEGKPAAEPPVEQKRDSSEAERRAHNSEGGVSKSSRATKQENPLAHVRCAGCGCTGTMSEQYVQAPSGTTVRMLVCNDCGNQSIV